MKKWDVRKVFASTRNRSVEIGEGFAGEGPNAAHINTVLGLRNGPVGTAFATALAQPTPGHVPFLAVWAPNVPVQPPTLFVNKATITNDRHGELTWGAAQAGVAAGVTAYVAERCVEVAMDELVLIVAVWVNPDASDADAVFANNREATAAALRRGGEDTDPHADSQSAIAALRAGRQPHNPYFQPR
jgi:5,6,7,8-tetrahydromethanopterin hydro-lyase